MISLKRSGGFFGLTSREKELLKPLPPVASTEALENRLMVLQDLRVSVFKRMRSPTISALDRAKYQADLTAVSAAIESTALRLRVNPTITRAMPRRT
jgi:hypothetical protein